MLIGFYAPMKSPDHPTPSGDRTMARLLIKALELSGHTVIIISQLRSWEGKGNLQAQQQIKTQAQQEIQRLSDQFNDSQTPDVLFTYHVYHKAPDWIGPSLAKRFAIPYLIAEASYAPKQEGGPWQLGHAQSLHCIQAADKIISLNWRDNECIERLLSAQQSIEPLLPFLAETPKLGKDRQNRLDNAQKYNANPDHCWLITTAMMRPGDKQASYRQLADTLLNLSHRNWTLFIIGDGATRDTVEGYFQAVAKNCVFLGQLQQTEIFQWLNCADLFVWPSINEAFGLSILEAQACALPAVVQDYGAVNSIVADNKSGLVCPKNQPAQFLKALQFLIDHQDQRTLMAINARKKFVQCHTIETAATKLKQIINQVTCS